MTQLGKMLELFDEIGLEFGTEPLSAHNAGWYDIPERWHGCDSVLAAGAVFVFDDGAFVGVGIGDEQSCFEEARDKEQRILG